MKRNALDIIREITHEIEGRKLPLEIMVRDIQMMRFKIRSTFGDISSLDTMHYEFIHALWKIGRADEIVTNSLDDLNEDDQEALIEFFKNIEEEIQQNIRDSLNLKVLSEEDEGVLKLEIFKDTPVKSTVN